MLVRPDGYVAWIGAEDSGPEGLPKALARWFGAPNPAARPAEPVTVSSPVA
jgi:bifunctional hydroxylase/dehydrase